MAEASTIRSGSCVLRGEDRRRVSYVVVLHAANELARSYRCNWPAAHSYASQNQAPFVVQIQSNCLVRRRCVLLTTKLRTVR